MRSLITRVVPVAGPAVLFTIVMMMRRGTSTPSMDAVQAIAPAEMSPVKATPPEVRQMKAVQEVPEVGEVEAVEPPLEMIVQSKAAAKKLLDDCVSSGAQAATPTQRCQAPNPWAHERDLSAYEYPDSMEGVSRCQALSFHELGLAPSSRQAESTRCEAIMRLKKHGLRLNSIGLDFSRVFSNRDSEYTYEDKMQDIAEASKVYQRDLGGTCKNCERLLQVDHDLRTRQRPLKMLVEPLRDKFAQFFRDGFTKIDNYGLNIEALQKEVRASMVDVPKEYNFKAVARRLEHLEPLFKDNGIFQLASFYLGSAVRVTGYKILRLGRKVKRKMYRSGDWHHDGCGSRLKLFVYLDEVGGNGHPTEVARGSQTVAYYTYPINDHKKSRFKNDFVNDEYEIVQMLGPRGGGFMFDTNTVHRGNIEGKQLWRDTIIIDIGSTEKLDH
eukprot:CAMPEP_0178409418 /NCGR_PEP_ID=MMETSP0689_2-20121128/20453_1 /TAXON_ID=160604 /ORGANISM="Amphidinium massartii, Strain CS-259" /LENGTH=440 /DNA_ID=CAMNT_0020030561 /DNA_START=46 /DNA_END=1365 /DNA_ORIENTATION=+